MAKYKVVGMLVDGGWGKDLNSGVRVDYQSARMREGYKVTVTDNKLWLFFAPMDTTAVLYLFVMDEEGNIFSGPQSDVAHHSAFMAGHPVAAAGTINVRDGLITAIYDQSGHYHPPLDYTKQFIDELKARGVNVTDDMKHFQGRTKSDLKKAYKKLGVSGSKRLYGGHKTKVKLY